MVEKIDTYVKQTQFEELCKQVFQVYPYNVKAFIDKIWAACPFWQSACILGSASQ